jgi:hypothetical protein
MTMNLPFIALASAVSRFGENWLPVVVARLEQDMLSQVTRHASKGPHGIFLDAMCLGAPFNRFKTRTMFASGAWSPVATAALMLSLPPGETR